MLYWQRCGMACFADTTVKGRKRAYPLVRYRIDGNDRICFVNPAFSAFARANDAFDLVGEGIIGRLLWEFISDETIRALNQMLALKARRTHRVVTFPYRCDSPELLRSMEMVILPLDHEMLEFQSHTVRQQSRPVQSLGRLRTRQPNASLRVCSWCNKVDTGGDNWQELEWLLARRNLLDENPPPSLTHGACPICCRILKGKIE